MVKIMRYINFNILIMRPESYILQDFHILFLLSRARIENSINTIITTYRNARHRLRARENVNTLFELGDCVRRIWETGRLIREKTRLN